MKASFETVYDNVKIFHSVAIRNGLRKPTRRYVIMGAFASDNQIYLGKCLVGSMDIVESLTIAEIISHETLHHVVAKLHSFNASERLDSMLQNRSHLDSGRVYVQKKKVDII